MATALFANTLTEAWLADLDYLHSIGGEELNLVTTIGGPDPDSLDARVMGLLDDWLLRESKQRVDTVANTIFPEALLRGCANRNQFYDRYRASFPRIRKLPKNGHGTYFGRLIDYPATPDVKRGATTNQIEGIIRKLETQLQTGRPKRFAYEAQIFAPGRDDTTLMGFPCLSSMSFQLDRRSLCLTAIYRNQYYFERALGNFLGLARLQRYIANEVELALGTLTIHACHAQIDTLNRRERARLISACRRVEPQMVAA